MDIKKLWGRVQNVLPLVYDDSLSYYEFLGKVVDKVNEIIENINGGFVDYIKEEIDKLLNGAIYRSSDKTVVISETAGSVTTGEDVAAIQIGLTKHELQNSPVVDIRKGKFLLMGNSYARGTGGTIGRGWCYYFKEFGGVDATIIQQAGGDFVARGNENADYPGETAGNALRSFALTLSTQARNTYDYIVYGGGYNDHGYTAAQIRDGVYDFIAACRTNFPKAKICLFPLSSGAPWDEDKSKVITAITVAATNECEYVCADYFKWFVGYTTFFATDNIHYTDAGYRALGRYIFSSLQGWNGYRATEENVGVTPNPDLTYTRLKVNRDGGMAYINMVIPFESGQLANATFLGNIGYGHAPGTTSYFAAFAYSSGANVSRRSGFVEIRLNGDMYFRNAEQLAEDTAYTLYLNAAWMIGM